MENTTLTADTLRAQAHHAAHTLRFLANPHRLMLLCALVEGEQNATALQALCGLSQSATSQHLARLRKQGIIVVRRYKQQSLYRLHDPTVAKLLHALYTIYCPQQETTP
jgi:DNA-binding transcriptional ArsR family regulator